MPEDVTFRFYKGNEDLVEPIFLSAEDPSQNWSAAAKKVSEAISGALGAQNLSFLLGSGCSSYREENGSEVGIPTMAPMAMDFIDSSREYDGLTLPEDVITALRGKLKIDLTHESLASNLERLMELLQAVEFWYKNEAFDHDDEALNLISSTIELVQRYILERCERPEEVDGGSAVLNLYMAFYRKLIYREQSLPSPWVFTTNYDLFNERALDRLGIPTCNGFSGTLERRFNPATFRYTLAEQMDISSRKWTAVDNYTYLVKLHGSINWGEDAASLYPIMEFSDTPLNVDKRLMIYPTPSKQHASLGSPYSDLFREFQGKIVREQSVLIVVGYSFGDEHINSIIYQALSIPTFRLIAFVSPNANAETEKLLSLNDPRVWFVAGGAPDRSKKAHYFDNFVHEFLPGNPSAEVDLAIQAARSVFGTA